MNFLKELQGRFPSHLEGSMEDSGGVAAVTAAADPWDLLMALSALPALLASPIAAPAKLLLGTGPGRSQECREFTSPGAALPWNPRIGFFLLQNVTKPAPLRPRGLPWGHFPKKPPAPASSPGSQLLTTHPEPPDTFQMNVTGIPGVPSTRPCIQVPRHGGHASALSPDLHITFLQVT